MNTHRQTHTHTADQLTYLDHKVISKIIIIIVIIIIINRMLAINVSIPNLKIARLVQF